MKVVLIDDHEIFLLGLVSLLQTESEIEVVGEATSGEAGLALVTELEPDAVVLDYSMPGISGLEILTMLKHRHPTTRVIILTASKSESVLNEATQSGADAIVLKQDASSQLVATILAIQDSGQIISSSARSLMQRSDALAELTRRERQVLRMIANGYRNREISEELSISMKTVDSHRTNLMRKLDLHNLVDLVELANEAGLSDTSI